MTDADTVQTAATLLGGVAKGPFLYPSHQKAGKKPLYEVNIYGQFAIAWMMTLYPLLCARRQQRIQEVIERWRQARTMKPTKRIQAQRKEVLSEAA